MSVSCRTSGSGCWRSLVAAEKSWHHDTQGHFLRLADFCPRIVSSCLPCARSSSCSLADHLQDRAVAQPATMLGVVGGKRVTRRAGHSYRNSPRHGRRRICGSDPVDHQLRSEPPSRPAFLVRRWTPTGAPPCRRDRGRDRRDIAKRRVKYRPNRPHDQLSVRWWRRAPLRTPRTVNVRHHRCLRVTRNALSVAFETRFGRMTYSVAYTSQRGRHGYKVVAAQNPASALHIVRCSCGLGDRRYGCNGIPSNRNPSPTRASQSRCSS